MSSTEPAARLELVGDDPPTTIQEYAHQRAVEHNARADLLAAQRDAEALIQARHDAYMAEGRRRLERLQLDQALEAVSWSRVQAPPTGAPFEPIAEWSGPVHHDDLDTSPGHDQESVQDLDAAARDLFDRQPDAGRVVVMRELGIDEYPAKKLIERRKAGLL